MKHAFRLANQYNTIVFFVFIMIAISMTVIGVSHYNRFVNSELNIITQKLNERRTNLDSILNFTTNYIQRLKLFIIQQLEYDNELMVQNSKLDKNVLEKLPNHIKIGSRGGDTGMSLYLLSVGIKNNDALKQIHMAEGLQEIFRHTIQTTNYFGWSYYASINGVAMVYPYVPEKWLLEGTETDNFDDAIDLAIWKQKHWIMSSPDKNPDGEPFWTEAYLDDAGQGLEVTHGTPIYIKGKYNGMVATDITLNFLKQTVHAFDYPHGKLSVTNNKEQVLAFTDYDPKGNKKEIKINDIYPKDIKNIITAYYGKSETRVKRTSDNIIFILSISKAPWQINYVLPREDLVSLFMKNNKSYLYIFAILVFALFFTNYLIKKRFVKPAISIIEYVHEDAKGSEAKLPALPPEWKRWYDLITTMPAMKAVTANLPGSVFRIIHKKPNYNELRFISKGLNGLFQHSDNSNENIDTLLAKFNYESDRVAFINKLEEASTAETFFEYECMLKDGDKKNPWVYFSAIPINNEGSTIFDGIILDVTERKIAEQELTKLNEELEIRIEQESRKRLDNEQALIQQSKLASMGEMLTNIAHQWRQPLGHMAGILTNIQLKIETDTLDKNYIQTIVHEQDTLLKYMSETINNFKDFLKPDKEAYPFTLSSSVEKSLMILGSLMDYHNIELKYSADSNVEVFGHSSEFCQALLNIFTNAKDILILRDIKKPIIYVRIYKDEEFGYIEISDNAGGIEDKYIPKIFEPFFTTREDGQGIGMYMAKNIVEKSVKGSLTVFNNDEGAVFKITMPLS